MSEEGFCNSLKKKTNIEKRQTDRNERDKRMGNRAIGSNWTDVRKAMFTAEEMAASNERVAIIANAIKSCTQKYGEITMAESMIIAGRLLKEKGDTIDLEKIEKIVKNIQFHKMFLATCPIEGVVKFAKKLDSILFLLLLESMQEIAKSMKKEGGA